MGKPDAFKGKPKPPTKEHILADLGTAGDDDVIFHTPYPTPESLNAPAVKVDKNRPGQSNTEQLGSDSEVQTDQATVNFTYDQVTRLIQLHSELSKQPEVLQEQYEQVQQQGEDVSFCINDLKQAAESVLQKHKASSKKTKKTKIY